MSGQDSKAFYDKFLAAMRKAHPGGEAKVKDGVFGAMMEVNIVNDGPVTLTIESEPKNKKAEQGKETS